ncbi:PUA-like domain-containing protein [Desarmillaria tabescens]|uniref:PUA-like domain-containing protein n=1 Tax=Armillaria tabescens TaxID=1929756 RepID=A0AA39TSL8_ARMTA|nr:PUA-like domain-containing protein [Desarmillaria tabescens]KAK0465148.1 PUA-like domain-containing protein [Desarmillaria tabescens]
MISAYEAQRNANIERNRELLKSLGLDTPIFEPTETKRKPKTAPKKRKAPPPASDDENPNKAARVEDKTDVSSSETGVRRSARNRGKAVDYKSEKTGESPMPIAFRAGVRTSGNEGPLGSGEGARRKHDPKVYGSIPGVEVGTWWETRQACSIDAIHAPWVGGISASKDGAYSVALSGGYDDDVDLGYAFTYTGSGGRDLKGTAAQPKNLRTAAQSSDQSFENTFNKALKRSSETKKPIRVIRGYKLRSPYAPSEGYRYDGLYHVEKAWIEKGLNAGGYLVCKFAFKRLPGQPPLPRRDTSEDSVEVHDKREDGAEETLSPEGEEED